MGIVLALSICASTSGGHLNPCVTIAFTLFKGFPVRKAPLYVHIFTHPMISLANFALRTKSYILSQILGAYVACLIVYLQWRTNILVRGSPIVIFSPGIRSSDPGSLFFLFCAPVYPRAIRPPKTDWLLQDCSMQFSSRRMALRGSSVCILSQART